LGQVPGRVGVGRLADRRRRRRGLEGVAAGGAEPRAGRRLGAAAGARGGEPCTAGHAKPRAWRVVLLTRAAAHAWQGRERLRAGQALVSSLEPETTMKIRSHLVLLVLGAVLPVLAFSAVMGIVFWRQQRTAFEQRFLERVRAMAVALDREHEGHARALQVLARSLRLAAGDLRGFYEEASGVRAEQRLSATIILADPAGAQLIN